SSVPPDAPTQTPIATDGNGDRYELLNREDELTDSYLTYAMRVIISRALPDVRDGLRPSRRRISEAAYVPGAVVCRSHPACPGRRPRSGGPAGQALRADYPPGRPLPSR